MKETDQHELRALKSRVTTAAQAAVVDTDVGENREFKTHTLQQFDPSGQTVINEFHFSSPEAAQEGVEYVKSLLPS